MAGEAPTREKVTPRKVKVRGLYSGEFSMRGTLEEVSKWRGSVEYGVRLENGNWMWVSADQLQEVTT